MTSFPRQLLPVLLLPLLVSACWPWGEPRWRHPGVSDAQFVEYVRQCEERAQAIVARDKEIDYDREISSPPDYDRRGTGELQEQMTELGYDKSFDKMVNRCLEGYGFRKVRSWSW